MIVFDLRCGQGHVFEAWFASSTAYDEQRVAKLIHCPMCDDADVAKAVMAPNIAAKGGGERPSPQAVKAALTMLAEAQRKALSGSEWVGRGFADRARAMHSGAADVAPIHGQATRAEAKALVEEGVPIAPLPLPVVPPEQAN
ncbi:MULTISPECIES: DUF1178 family protein [unclassified Sphingomonas]|uniref:DUF1178 family protein n=1 Tax=unclassified Sphingomonas TaxID=196159 RepID=UPI0006F70FED|nr:MULTISPECIES: DUF1178 family protein [unclassified Sphingomonas]KQM98134.1 hypothetical protein ASE78_07700 [Sphingomonas sp. Leaf25]KQN37676.1 hypothetical protein ASE97_08970 [Sphingomonas sp. Leaf42]KQT28043.1 hypothetical protein ASG37_11680 [Sphingomonas sp. Leaf407]